MLDECYRIIPRLTEPEPKNPFWVYFISMPLWLVLPGIAYPVILVFLIPLSFIEDARGEGHIIDDLGNYMFSKPHFILVESIAIPLALFVGILLCTGSGLRERQRLRREWIRQSEEIAQNISKEAKFIRSSFLPNLQRLPILLAQAQRQLAAADREYKESAYGPFWDCVEEAAQSLASFSALVSHLHGSLERYRGLLVGRIHNFPILAIEPTEIPDPSETSIQFQKMVRAGQTNIDFAHIWELRRTRQVLIQGFKTLSEVINHLEESVLNAIEGLKRAVLAAHYESLTEQRMMRSAFEMEARRWEDFRRRHL